MEQAAADTRTDTRQLVKQQQLVDIQQYIPQWALE